MKLSQASLAERGERENLSVRITPAVLRDASQWAAA